MRIQTEVILIALFPAGDVQGDAVNGDARVQLQTFDTKCNVSSTEPHVFASYEKVGSK